MSDSLSLHPPLSPLSVFLRLSLSLPPSVSRCIADCLNVGSNLVTVALVAGELDELKRALALAPRGQRADWITRVSK